MSRNDFCLCTPEQFKRIYDSYRQRCDINYKAGWEQTRSLCMSMMQPHSKKKLRSEDVMKFPWDKHDKHEEVEVPTKEQQEERYRAARRRYGID